MSEPLSLLRQLLVIVVWVVSFSTIAVAAVQTESTKSTKEKASSPPKIKLRVRVVDSSGHPITNASAVVQEVGVTTKYEKVGVTTTSGVDGVLESEELPAKRSYRLVIRHADFQPAVSRCNHVLDQGEVTLVDVILPGWRTIHGTVVDDESNPLTDIRVFQSGDSPKTVSTTTDQQGRFSLAGFPEQAAIVFFEHPDYWFTGQIVLPDQSKNITRKLCLRSKTNLENWDADLAFEPAPEDRQRMKQFIDNALQKADETMSAMSPEQIKALKKQSMGPFFLRQLGQLDPKYSRLFVGARSTSFYAVLYDIKMRSIDRKLAWIASEEKLQQKMNGLNQTSTMLHNNFAGVGQAELGKNEKAEIEKQIVHAAISLIPEARQTDSVESAIDFQARLAIVLHQNGETELASRMMNSAVSLLQDYRGAVEEQLRFRVAEYLTQFGDVDQAIALTKSVKQEIFRVMLAYEVVKTAPDKAFELVKDFEFKVNQGSRISATHGLPILCYHAAKKDTDLALRFAELCEKCQVRGTVSPALPKDADAKTVAMAKALPRKLLKAKLHAFIAAQIAEREPERSRKLFEQSIQTICDAEHAIENPSAGFIIAPISYLTSIVSDVSRMDSGLAAETAWRALSIRLEQDLFSPPWDQQNNLLFPLTMLKQLDRHAYELAEPALSNLQKLTYAGNITGYGIAHTPLDVTMKIEHTRNQCDRASGLDAISPKTRTAVDLAVSFQRQLNNEGMQKTRVGELVTASIHSSMWIQFARD